MIETSYLIESLGAAMVRQLIEGRRTTIRDVHLADTCDEAYQYPDSLVLGHGVHNEAAAAVFLRQSARSSASAVVLQGPVVHQTAVVELAGTLGLSLIELRPNASWTHLVWLVRSILDQSSAVGGPDTQFNSAGEYSELFVFADAAARIVSAPVTIEDAHSRVLAYSELQEPADPARISTIVGRRVPESIVRHFRSRGVFRRMHTSDTPIEVDSGPGGVLPRLVIPVRASRELLGSIWVVDPGAVSDEQLVELTRTASVLALHLLRLRAVSGAVRRLHIERLRAALTVAGEEPQVPLPRGPWRVVALLRGFPEQDFRQQLELWELSLRRFGWAEPTVTEIDGIPMAVVADAGAAHTAGSWTWLKEVAKSMRVHDSGIVVVAGGSASRPSELSRSRQDAMALVALARVGRVDSAAAIDDVWQEVIIARAVTSLRRGPMPSASPVAVLVEQDRQRGTEYIRTLSTYLEHFREPKKAADILGIHSNTLRYRMRSILGLTGIDLNDSRLRLALLLHTFSVLEEDADKIGRAWPAAPDLA